jgi:hypothetical protein
MLLRGSDNIRYGHLKVELANNMTKGVNNYPKLMAEPARLLNDYKVAVKPPRAWDDPREGLAFVQEQGGACRGSNRGENEKQVTPTAGIMEKWGTTRTDAQNLWWKESTTLTSTRQTMCTVYSAPRGMATL